jgi:Tol biopolymer transport system component
MKTTVAIVFTLLTVGILGFALMPGGPAESREAIGLSAQTQVGGPVVHRVYEGPDVGRFSGNTLSPDGRYVVTRDLGMLDLITGEFRRVVDWLDWIGGSSFGSSGWNERARYSPDGSRIAYSWYSSECDCYEIHIVDADGSNPLVLLRSAPRRGGDNVPEPMPWQDLHGWSPDGKSLLVTFWPDPNATEISLVSVANGTHRVIYTTDGRGPNFAALSPDGQLLAFDMVKERSGTESDVFVVPVNGGTPMLVVSGPSQDTPLGWAPDGSLLVYSDREFNEGVWRLPFRDGHPDSDLELLKGGLWGMQPMGVSGSRFAYGLHTQAPQVHLTSIDLERNRIGTTYTPVEETLRESSSPAWSSDGRWLAYTTVEMTRGGGGRALRLIVRPLAGGDSREISPEGLGGFQDPLWANGDSNLIALSRNAGAEGGWVTIDLETGEATLMGPRREDLMAVGLEPGSFVRGLRGRFSPDLKTFYKGDGSQIYALDLTDSSRSGVVVSFDGPVGTPLSVSPTGDRIAAWSSGALWVVDTRTGEKTALHHRPGGLSGTNLKIPFCNYANTQWTLDAQSLLFKTAEGIPQDAEFGPRPCQVYKIPVTGGEPVYVGALPEHRTWALHPDGTHLALQYGENRSEIWIMEDLPGSG